MEGVYILTMKNGTKERWEIDTFNKWVAAQGEHIGANLETRLDQFKRYTGQPVVDWEWQDK